MTTRKHDTRVRTTAVVAVGALVALATACSGGDSSPADGRPTVVVTFPVLGAVVSDLVGDAAEVRVLMPAGVDPHEWQPSAKDIETVGDAAVVVAIGLDMEASIEDALQSAVDDGTVLFEAGDHVDVRIFGADEITDEGAGAPDPHLWMDPMALRDAMDALAPVLADNGIDVGPRLASVDGDLEALTADVQAIIDTIPADQRRIVSGHESLGWFADRFGLDLVGAVVPSATSQAEPSAGDLSDLAQAIQDAGVTTIFTEIGTPASVVEGIADETGATVVDLGTHTLPADGTYRTFMLDIATTIAAGSGAPAGG